MKSFEITKQQLAEYYATIPGSDGTDRELSRALHSALTSYGAQAEYITELINVWFTAYNAAERTKKRVELMVFRGSHENAQRYITDILRGFGVLMDGVVELSLFRVLELGFNQFKNESKRVLTSGGNNETSR